jgi:hypothetical protein
MSIEPEHLREVIVDTLKSFDTHIKPRKALSRSAVEMLMLTAAQETYCGRYLRQIRGPALGIFQMEPRSFNDLMLWVTTKKKWIKSYLDPMRNSLWGWEIDMKANIPFQIVVARVYYLRVPEQFPPPEDVEAMARYYKKYWNTHLGAATVEEAMKNYARYGGHAKYTVATGGGQSPST